MPNKRTLSLNPYRLEWAMAAKSWNREQLAAAAGVSLQTLVNACCGKPVTVRTAYRLTAALEADPDELIAETDYERWQRGNEQKISND